MPAVDLQKLYRDLEKKVFQNVYLFFGEEPYQVGHVLKYFEQILVPEGMADFNLNIFNAGEADNQIVKESLQTLPMMNPYRLVILKDAHVWTESQWEDLFVLIENPVQSSIWVIVCDKIDKRKKSIKNLLQKSTAVEFKKPYDNQVPQWIRQIVQQYQGEIEEEAIYLLHKYIGSSLIALDNEIQKLLEYTSQRQIKAEDVRSLVSRTKEESVFDFIRAVSLGHRALSLELLVQLLDQGQSEVGIVSLLARHIRILMILKKGQLLGMSGPRLAQFAQVPPYFLDSYLQQSDLWPLKKLESALVVLSETEKALKSSPLSSHIWLENMVFRLGQLNRNYEHSRIGL